MPKLLIVGDPTGSTSLDAINNRGWSPEDITVWENDPRHVYAIRCISGIIDIILDDNKLTKLKECAMKFDVVIGNPPYGKARDEASKAKNSNNTLYIDFINIGIDLLNSGGIMSLTTPPSALTKGNSLHHPTKTLEKMTQAGNLSSIDYTVRSTHFSTVGVPICRWVFTEGEEQGKVSITHEDAGISGLRGIDEIYYLPDSVDSRKKPNIIEFNLYRKIVSNKVGRALHVIRSDNQLKLDGTIRTFGYPNVTLGGGEGRLNYKAEDHEFFMSKTGLWLLDYLRRTDQQLSHLQLNGIIVPEGGYTLTEDESEFIESGDWRNSAK